MTEVAAAQDTPAFELNGDAGTAKHLVESALKVRILEPFSGIVLLRRGRPFGACIFDRYTGRDVHFTCVSKGLMPMCLARAVARYVFEKLGCHRCTAVTRGTNERAVRALVQLGFKYEGTMREYFDDADGIVFGLLRSDQKIVRL